MFTIVKELDYFVYTVGFKKKMRKRGLFRYPLALLANFILDVLADTELSSSVQDFCSFRVFKTDC